MLNWQCCLAGTSKKAPKIFIFSIAMGADYSMQIVWLETTFFKISCLSFFLRYYNFLISKDDFEGHENYFKILPFFRKLDMAGLSMDFSIKKSVGHQRHHRIYKIEQSLAILPRCHWLSTSISVESKIIPSYSPPVTMTNSS